MTWEGQGNILHGLVQQLREDVARLREVVLDSDLPGRVRFTENQLMRLRDVADDMETHLERTAAQAQEATALARRIDARVLWLERRIRLSEARVDEIDDVTPDLVHLAASAEAGALAALALLPEPTRLELAAAVDVHDAATATLEAERDHALAAARTLADTPQGSAAHRAGLARYRTARATMADARDRAVRHQDEAREARRRLRRDDALREDTAATIEEGARADRELRGRLRDSVAEAVGTAALLPGWFTTVLGPMPPAEDTERWMDVACDLVAYRITYRITDPMVALGATPGRDANPRRQAWWRSLTAAFQELQH